MILTLLLLPREPVAQIGKLKRIALYPVIPNPTEPEFAVSIPIPASALPKTVSVRSSPNISLPLDEYRITSRFGWRKHPITGKSDFHNGIDLAARGKIVRNIMDGKVTETGYHKNLGIFVRVDHGAVHSIYGHLSQIAVEKEQDISAGHPIGMTGSTGRATGEHLHFSIRRNGTYINPWKFLHGLIQQIDNEH